MDITSLGHSSFRLRAKSATIVTDPYESTVVGLKFPKHVTADVVTISHAHEDHNAVSQIDGTPYIISGPGEYEIKGVGIVGLSVYHDDEKGARRGKSTIYRIELEGVSIVHLGDLGHMLSADQIDSLDGIDVIMVPVGGVYTIDAATAAELVSEIEPTIVIPMHYHRKELNQQSFGSLQPLSAFLKEIGKEHTSSQPKLTISKDKLPSETQVVILE